MSRRLTDKQIVQALHATLGKVCLAAEKLGCLPDAIYSRAKTSRTVRETIRFFRGKLLDSAESAVWKGVLDGESWAVKLAFTEWGRSRDFSDGAEIWQGDQGRDETPPRLAAETAERIMDNADYSEYCRARQLDIDAGPVRGQVEPGPVENGAAPGGDRSRGDGDDSRPIGSDSGD